MKRSSNSGSFTLAAGDNPFQRGARTTRVSHLDIMDVYR